MTCFGFCDYSWSCVILDKDWLVEGRCKDLIVTKVRHLANLMDAQGMVC